MIILNEEQKRIIKNNVRKDVPISINGVNYFTKCHFTEVAYDEIIAERVAKLLGIRCAHYEAVKIDEYIYRLSEDLNDLGTFITADKLEDIYAKKEEDDNIDAYHPNSLYKWWNILSISYPNNVSELMQELINVYFFDIIVMNPDRSKGNWGVMQSKDGVHIYAFDNEYIFSSLKSELKSSYEDESQIEDNVYNNHKINMANIMELAYFLKTSSKEFANYLINMLEIITPDKFKKVIEEIEEEYGDIIYNKDDIIKKFTENYNAIGSLLCERGYEWKENTLK